MNPSLRLSEKWFRRGLWLVAFVFAGFLIGLGGAVLNDLPQVENIGTPENFINRTAEASLNIELEAAQKIDAEATAVFQELLEKRKQARQATADEQETFQNWLAARKATEQSEHNAEVVERTHKLDRLKAAEIALQKPYDEASKTAKKTREALRLLEQKHEELKQEAYMRWQEEARAAVIRVFFYRLAFTLPLLGVSAFLFIRYRKGNYWPFVWGFIFFALFAFFVELVPYLPSFGGYVRYGVGIVVTAIVGRYAILALDRYLKRQKLAESLPNVDRRRELDYEIILARLNKNICPGCERGLDFKNDRLDHCPHCGIQLFSRCPQCTTRRSAFARFCFSCGSAEKEMA